MDLCTLEQALEASLAPMPCSPIPSYRAWSEGCLSREDLARYAEQYRYSVAVLPALLQTAHAATGDAATRTSLERNLDEEEGRVGPAHAALWEQFARAVGAADEARALPETAEASVALRAAMGDDEVSQLAALWAYEVQTARVAETKETGLRQYGVEGAEALAFFRMHGALDVHHARELLESLGRALGRGGMLQQATEAVTFAGHSGVPGRRGAYPPGTDRCLIHSQGRCPVLFVPSGWCSACWQAEPAVQASHRRTPGPVDSVAWAGLGATSEERWRWPSPSSSHRAPSLQRATSIPPVVDRRILRRGILAVAIVFPLRVATVVALVVAGQLGCSLLFDRFAVLGVPYHPLTPGRVLGAVLLVVGVALIRR